MINNLLDYEDMTTLIDQDTTNIKQLIPRNQEGLTVNEFKNAIRLLFSPEPTNYKLAITTLKSIGFNDTKIICIIDRFIKFRISTYVVDVMQAIVQAGINPIITTGNTLRFEFIIKIKDKIEAKNLSMSAFYLQHIDYTNALYMRVECACNLAHNHKYTYNHRAELWCKSDKHIKYGNRAYVHYSELHKFITKQKISL